MTISTIKLTNFKAYAEQQFDLSNLTVFCGTNSVGKSTAIQSLGMVLQSQFSQNISVNGELVSIGSIRDLHHHQNEEQMELSIEIAIDNIAIKWGYQDFDAQERAIESNQLMLLSDADNWQKVHNQILNDNLLHFQYLQAERFGPRDNLPIKQHQAHKNWLGTSGEHTINVLHRLKSMERTELTGQPQKSSKKDPRQHASKASNNLFDNIEAWMAEISPSHRLSPNQIEQANISFNTIRTANRKETKSINIGFGYSYALSIVVALLCAKHKEVVIIENPEAHLHPKGQSYIGRLVALAALSGVQVIIETHSEHVINGIRVIQRLENDFTPEMFTLYFVSQDNNGSRAKKITMNNESKLSDWPEGFFDQQSLDMFTIMTGKSKPEQAN